MGHVTDHHHDAGAVEMELNPAKQTHNFYTWTQDQVRMTLAW